LASLGSFCQEGFALASTNGGANPNFNTLVNVIAHKLAHDFGAGHDTLIMGRVAGPSTPQIFSIKSINEIKVKQLANITPQCVSAGSTFSKNQLMGFPG
jgi:hypothetical protein